MIISIFQQRKHEMVTFIQDNLKRKECIRFVPKKDKKPRKDGDPIKYVK